jgi:uncharacterized repeat protein (TIGR01451 family)
MCRSCLAAVLSAFLSLPGYAQHAPPLAHGPAPLLYVRVSGIPAMQVRFYPGGPASRDFAAGVTAGLRPGYIYRIGVGNLPGHPGVTLFPSLEIRGSLEAVTKLRPADHPAPIPITEDDVNRILAGTLITKVIYLEDPERALPVATQPGEPVEVEIRPGEDPLEGARALGRPMVILRLGSRTLTAEELASQAIANTILLPGDATLGPPAAPPFIPWACFPVYDPRYGPRPPIEECLRDGGDAGLPVGLDAQGNLQGVDPADTVARYRDSKGQLHVAISNPVCICVPRFAVLRLETNLIGYQVAVPLGATMATAAGELVQFRQPSLLAQQQEETAALKTRQKPSVTANVEGVAIAAQLETPAVVLAQLKEQTVIGSLVKECPPPDRPLVLCKSADKQQAHIGDVVTFYLRYTNQGGQPMTDVAVVDSLTGRLEFVPGSDKSDRTAVFTTQPNEAGSVVLRWEINGRLLPGQSGVVSFQARIR